MLLTFVLRIHRERLKRRRYWTTLNSWRSIMDMSSWNLSRSSSLTASWFSGYKPKWKSRIYYTPRYMTLYIHQLNISNFHILNSFWDNLDFSFFGVRQFITYYSRQICFGLETNSGRSGSLRALVRALGDVDLMVDYKSGYFIGVWTCNAFSRKTKQSHTGSFDS